MGKNCPGGGEAGREIRPTVYSEWSHLNFLLTYNMSNKLESPGDSAGCVRNRLISQLEERETCPCCTGIVECSQDIHAKIGWRLSEPEGAVEIEMEQQMMLNPANDLENWSYIKSFWCCPRVIRLYCNIPAVCHTCH